MTTMKTLVRHAKSDAPDLVVTPLHYEWLALEETGEQVYSPEAIDFVARALRGEYEYERSGRISPSSLGECHRRVMLSYAGAPKEGADPESKDMMGLGTWGHLRWQAEALSMGWAEQCEWFVRTDPDGVPMTGSVDIRIIDDSLFELKTMRSQLYARYVVKEETTKPNHLLQVEPYFRMSGATHASLVYEDRDSGAFHEFRVEREDRVVKEVDDLLERYGNHIADDTLPPMLPDCVQQVGRTYRRCPYRRSCPVATSLTRVGEAA